MQNCATGIVTPDIGLWLLDTPAGDTIEALPKGTEVLIEEVGPYIDGYDWIRVTVKGTGKRGWVAAVFVDVLPEPKPAPQPKPKPWPPLPQEPDCDDPPKLEPDPVDWPRALALGILVSIAATGIAWIVLWIVQ